MAPEGGTGAADPPAAAPPQPKAPHPPASLVFLCTVCAGLALALLSNLMDGQETLKRVAGRSYAPLLSEAYGPEGHSLITVLTIDDGDLRQYGLSWPVPLDFHGRLIQRIERRHPKAIFLDVVFLDDRPAEQVEAFGDAVCAVAAKGVPFYYASFARADLTSNVEAMFARRRVARPDDQTPGPEDGTQPLCALPVRAHLLHDRLDQNLWTYALNAPPGERIDPASPRPPTSVARTLYCLHDPARCPPDTDEPMALLWPTRADHSNPLLMVRPNAQGQLESVCRGQWHWIEAAPFHGLGRRAKAWLQGQAYQPLAPLCPYHKVLPASAFQGIGLDADELHYAINGRYVLIGVNLTAVSDHVLSPVHGRVPGVHAHAVALDNLITLKGDYLRGGDIRWPLEDGHWVGVNSATRFALLSFALLAAVMIPFTRAMGRWMDKRRDALGPRERASGRPLPGPSHPSRRRPLRGLAWLLLFALVLALLAWGLHLWGGPPRLALLVPLLLAWLVLVRGQPVFAAQPLQRLVLLQRALEVLAYSALSTLIVVLAFYAFHQGPLVIIEYLGLAALSGALGWGEKLARNAQAVYAALGEQNPVLSWNRYAAGRAASRAPD